MTLVTEKRLDMIELLRPVFQGQWARHGEALIVGQPAAHQAMLLDELLAAPSLLAAILRKQARQLNAADPRPVASYWLLQYAGLLLPPVTAASTLLQHALPVARPEIALQVSPQGSPLRFILPHTGHSSHGENTAQRYAPLLQQHLTPLIATLAMLVRVPQKVLWGNVARQFHNILDLAEDLYGKPAPDTTLARDRAYLLEQPRWAGNKRNPLFGKRRTVLQRGPDDMRRVVLHQQCCLVYRIPNKGYCGACPLAPQLRQADLV